MCGEIRLCRECTRAKQEYSPVDEVARHATLKIYVAVTLTVDW